MEKKSNPYLRSLKTFDFLPLGKCLVLLFVLWFTTSNLNGQILISENFNLGLPSNWSISNGGSSTATWFRTTGGYNGQFLDGTEFMFVNSDAAGNIPAVLLHEELYGPIVNTTSFGTLILEFDQFFNHVGLTDSGHVEVFDGNTWRRVLSLANTIGGFSNPNHVQLNVSAYSNANFQFRFVYDDNYTWAWFWAIDNVVLSAPANLDAGVGAWVVPATNGRELTSLAFGTSELIQVSVHNFGTDTLSNIPIFYQADLGTIVGPEIIPGPLAPGQSINHSFLTGADLSALGTHILKAWTGLATDANMSNDTFHYQIAQLANPALAFPHCINFEGIPDTTLQHYIVGMPGLDEMDYWTSLVGAGRMRTTAGTGFAHGGNRAITFDRSPSGAPDAINFATFTWNLAGYDANTDVFRLDFWLMEHGDELQLRDSVWIRGCDTCNWIRVLSWNQMTGGVNGVYFNSPSINLSSLLLSQNQNYSTSFQLRIGQEDNFPATSLTASDGMSFDDICLRRILPINAGVTKILAPLANGQCGDTATSVSIRVKNLGTSSLSNIPVEVEVSGGSTANLQGTIIGPVAAGDSATIVLGPFNSSIGGQFQISAWTAYPGDLSVLDDTLRKWVNLSPELSSPLVYADTVCIGAFGWVHVLQADSSLEYTWFDSFVGGNVLGKGDSLYIGPLTQTTSYYVEPKTIIRDHLGPVNNQFGQGQSYSNYPDGLVFDALIDFEIDSVTVFPLDTGIVVLVLRNSAGITLDSISVLVQPAFPEAATQIPVGISVPMGNGYRLSGPGSTVPGLYRHSSGANYPYLLPNVARITGPINALSGYYYFWYDWVLKYANCPGPRAIASADTTSFLPQAQFSHFSNGLDVTFSNLSQHSNNVFWDFGDGTQSSQNAIQHTYAVDGNYVVCLIAYNSCGSDTICDTVQVNCLPIQQGFFYNVSGLQIQVTDTSLAQTISGRSWDFGDGNTGILSTETHSYASDGTYEVCLSNWNVCQDTVTNCDSVLLCAPITALISANQNGGAGLAFDFANLGSGTPISWLWDFGDGGMDSIALVNHVYQAAGNYIVTLIVANLCGETDTASFSISPVTIEEDFDGNLKIWPNPASDLVNIQVELTFDEMLDLKLWDLQGIELLQQKVQGISGENRYLIPIEGISSGAYFLELQSDNIHFRKMILIQHD